MMEQKTIERRIHFEVPNSINLQAELWDKQPSNKAVQTILDYFPVVGLAVFTVLIVANNLLGHPFSFGWAFVAFGVTILLHIAVHVAYKIITQKQRKRQLNYRKAKIAQLSALFEEHGYVIPEEEQLALTSTRRSKVRVLNADEVRYRADFLGIDDEKIAATLYLSDPKVTKMMRKSERELYVTRRVQLLTEAYEEENGAFATLELKEAFLEGARTALQ